MTDDPFAAARYALVEHMQHHGIADDHVLEAMRRVPRHHFVPAEWIANAYDNNPVPIGYKQTISQPYVVALMTELLQLEGTERVLEIGTGSGYQAAILGCLAREVYSIERVSALRQEAEERMRTLGYDNVKVMEGDGSLGCPEHGPFDGIIVTAAAPRVPRTLLDQLAAGGRLVLPVGGRHEQTLECLTKTGDHYETTRSVAVRFVPLLGEEGWKN